MIHHESLHIYLKIINMFPYINTQQLIRPLDANALGLSKLRWHTQIMFVIMSTSIYTCQFCPLGWTLTIFFNKWIFLIAQFSSQWIELLKFFNCQSIFFKNFAQKCFGHYLKNFNCLINNGSISTIDPKIKKNWSLLEKFGCYLGQSKFSHILWTMIQSSPLI